MVLPWSCPTCDEDRQNVIRVRQKPKFADYAQSTELTLAGSAEYDAHDNIGRLNSPRHLLTNTTASNMKNIFFSCMRAQPLLSYHFICVPWFCLKLGLLSAFLQVMVHGCFMRWFLIKGKVSLLVPDTISF